MKSGTFVNYQLAEAILLLHEYNNFSSIDFNIALDGLKKKWKEDKIPSTGSPVPDLYNMQNITFDELVKLDSKLDNYDTFTTENAANMQTIFKKSSNGEIEFDFSYLDPIVKLAKEKNKKVVIDSAIVFGDRYPEIFEGFSRDDLEPIIKEYIKKLADDYGDDIDRIDVLNAVFNRREIEESYDESYDYKKDVEGFWIERFGDNYGKEIIDICKNSLGEKNIPLCWNEFYITYPKFYDRKNKFLDMVGSIDNLDIIGLQDTFRDSADSKETIDVLKEVEDQCLKSSKEAAITEFSCKISGETTDYLKSVKDDPIELDNSRNKIEGRISRLMENITNYVGQSKSFNSLEGRLSKEFDFNAYLPEVKEYNIDTVGYDWLKVVKPEKSYENLSESHDKELEVMISDSNTNSDIKEYNNEKNIESHGNELEVMINESISNSQNKQTEAVNHKTYGSK